MASIFWDSQEVTMIGYLEQRSHDNRCILCTQIVTATLGNRKMRQGKLTHGVLLLQDNAPAHTLQVAMTAATEYGYEILHHPHILRKHVPKT